MKKIIYILITFVSIALLACEKQITIKPPPYDSKPGIQCMLEPDSIPIVYFNNTVPYFSSSVSLRDLVIRNAQITIQSNSGVKDSLRLDSFYNKLYCDYDYYYKGTLPALPNKTYTLTIKSGQDVFTATAQTNLIAPSIDSLGYTTNFNDLFGGHEGVITYFTDVPSQTNFYRYEMVRYVDTSTKKANGNLYNSCLGRDSLLVHELGRSVYKDEGLQGLQIKMVIEPAYTHEKGTKGTVFVQSLDKNAYDFFDQLDRQKLSQFNPFVEPVFLQNGQFGSKAIGYFSAMKRSVGVSFVFPE